MTVFEPRTPGAGSNQPLLQLGHCHYFAFYGPFSASFILFYTWLGDLLKPSFLATKKYETFSIGAFLSFKIEEWNTFHENYWTSANPGERPFEHFAFNKF